MSCSLSFVSTICSEHLDIMLLDDFFYSPWWILTVGVYHGARGTLTGGRSFSWLGLFLYDCSEFLRIPFVA